ncbi:hypothetical protein SISNIDRAFT_451815 [Sistotremastrum niveocremeum HHB9708]|uniref:RING-CH-type domain-containing protein n=1 Tax=Sistotremastrum niveocremeum HHB9708 TaxID=1314777 RepID=A0A164XMT9_9AGAM|nr:hypothetical protein SISNIDRAFT_451815 [Sistotremastrum niveocremeum HHB9708]
MPDDNDNDKQCRICLGGADPTLGKLFKPCRCDGSMRYVHVDCLNTWRKASPSRSAFYSCQQCGYQYRFARTRVVGLATSPFVIAVTSLNLFILVVFMASFLGSFVVNWISDETPSSWTYYWRMGPVAASGDLIGAAIHLFDDTYVHPRSFASSVPLREPSPPGLIARLIQRFMLGLSVVGITSFVQWLWSISLIGNFGLFRFRGIRERRQRGGGNIVAALLVMFVVAGAARALLTTYRVVEKYTKRFLVRAEYAILEVSD